jgi:hypothetical protein
LNCRDPSSADSFLRGRTSVLQAGETGAIIRLKEEFIMAGILDRKVAITTGAGSGIGLAASKIFAREGARVVLADAVEEGGQETLRMLKDEWRRRYLRPRVLCDRVADACR